MKCLLQSPCPHQLPQCECDGTDKDCEYRGKCKGCEWFNKCEQKDELLKQPTILELTPIAAEYVVELYFADVPLQEAIAKAIEKYGEVKENGLPTNM